MKERRVWGMMDFNDEGKQERAVVATTNKAEAARAFNVSMYHLNLYASQTFNKVEVALALKYPGRKVFVGGLT